MELNRVKAFGENFNIKIKRIQNKTILTIEDSVGKKLLEKELSPNETVDFKFDKAN